MHRKVGVNYLPRICVRFFFARIGLISLACIIAMMHHPYMSVGTSVVRNGLSMSKFVRKVKIACIWVSPHPVKAEPILEVVVVLWLTYCKRTRGHFIEFSC